MKTELPQLFLQLMELGCLSEENIIDTADGFRAAVKSLADILIHRDIRTFQGESGTELECRLFFDDWYLYAVQDGNRFVYSLFKMREQEHDAQMGLNADGDIPGVTVSFIAMKTELLLQCLAEPSAQNRKRLGREINRVVAYGGQRHDGVLKAYFIRTEARGAYLIARLYAEHIAAFAVNGIVDVPEHYASDYSQSGVLGRVAGFIEENNKAAGRVVCDHERIYIADPQQLSEHERLAILATHTGNVSLFSFAAEVQFHAKFLTWWARIPIPIIGKSPYASAIRADMSIGDAELTGPTPYYRSNSRIVKRQYRYHKDQI